MSSRDGRKGMGLPQRFVTAASKCTKCLYYVDMHDATRATFLGICTGGFSGFCPNIEHSYIQRACPRRGTPPRERGYRRGRRTLSSLSLVLHGSSSGEESQEGGRLWWGLCRTHCRHMKPRIIRPAQQANVTRPDRPHTEPPRSHSRPFVHM